MVRPVRIGNAHGFWGDRLEAASEMLAREPDLDFLTLDFLAEVSMSILAAQQTRDPQAGWPRDFLEIVRSIAPYWRGGGKCRIVTNAGGLNPVGCALACKEALMSAGSGDRKIAVVAGDDVLGLIQSGDIGDELLRSLDTRQSINEVKNRIVTANAYLGARPIADALAQGADLVITGRVADPSLTVGPCVQWFGWSWDDWDRLAGATVAGHLIECGTQVTGGISTDWLQVPDMQCVGFPIAEVASDGSCIITKPHGTGGSVREHTVKEQLLYEIGDPNTYLSPDVTVSFVQLELDNLGNDRIAVRGAKGRPHPETLKVSATYQDGFRAQGMLTIFGENALAKARRAGEVVLARLASRGVVMRESLVEFLGVSACRPHSLDSDLAAQLSEIVLRIAVADDSRENVEQFTREIMPLVTAGPPGTTGYADGRPRVHPMFRYWPCLVSRQSVAPQVTLLEGGEWRVEDEGKEIKRETPAISREDQITSRHPTPYTLHPSPASRLADLAYARSGDKGINANIGVIARKPDDFAMLCREATAERVATYLGIADAHRVMRYELPNLTALNFVVQGILDNPLRNDSQGKALGQVLLEMPLEEL